VGERVLAEHGAVSEQTVIEMARGAVGVSGADIGLAVSGVAGPEGGTPEKPVGTVWIAVALNPRSTAARNPPGTSAQKRGGAEAQNPPSTSARLFTFSGSRDMIRRRTAVAGMLFAEARLLGRDFLDTRAKW
jgi:nicotinamide mononucleotide (NMN) deamidase PncC